MLNFYKKIFQTFPIINGIRARHKDMHSLRVNTIKKDDGVETSNNLELFPLANKDNSEDLWGTRVLGNLIPNENTLDSLYIMPRVIKKGQDYEHVEVDEDGAPLQAISFSEIPIVIIRCSKNNTKVLVIDPSISTDSYLKLVPQNATNVSEDPDNLPYTKLASTSCGREGFKNAKKGTNIAGQTVGFSIATKLLLKGVNMVRVVVKGLGPGRMSSVKGLQMGGLKIVSITDDTTYPNYLVRPRKIRRI